VRFSFPCPGSRTPVPRGAESGPANLIWKVRSQEVVVKNLIAPNHHPQTTTAAALPVRRSRRPPEIRSQTARRAVLSTLRRGAATPDWQPAAVVVSVVVRAPIRSLPRLLMERTFQIKLPAAFGAQRGTGFGSRTWEATSPVVLPTVQTFWGPSGTDAEELHGTLGRTR